MKLYIQRKKDKNRTEISSELIWSLLLSLSFFLCLWLWLSLITTEGSTIKTLAASSCFPDDVDAYTYN